MSAESLKQQEPAKRRVRRLHFKPELLVSADDERFLDDFLEVVRAGGFDANDLVFSGFSSMNLTRGRLPSPKTSMFMMNESGWREALTLGKVNPAQYSEARNGVERSRPCIGLYDKTQLTEVYAHDFKDFQADNVRESISSTMVVGGEAYELDDIEFADEPIDASQVELGRPLADIPIAEPIEEEVVHRDYPNGFVSDALVGMVFIDHEE